MVASYLSVQNSSYTLTRKGTIGLENQKNIIFKLRFLMVFVFFTCAICLAPDNPEHLASICQRHNSVNACQVW